MKYSILSTILFGIHFTSSPMLSKKNSKISIPAAEDSPSAQRAIKKWLSMNENNVHDAIKNGNAEHVKKYIKIMKKHSIPLTSKFPKYDQNMYQMALVLEKDILCKIIKQSLTN